MGDQEKHAKVLKTLETHLIAIDGLIAVDQIKKAFKYGLDAIAERDALRKDCYIVPKGAPNRKEEIILHNLICRDAEVSDCEEAAEIAKVLVKAGYTRKEAEAR